MNKLNPGYLIYKFCDMIVMSLEKNINSNDESVCMNCGNDFDGIKCEVCGYFEDSTGDSINEESYKYKKTNHFNDFINKWMNVPNNKHQVNQNNDAISDIKKQYEIWKNFKTKSNRRRCSKCGNKEFNGRTFCTMCYFIKIYWDSGGKQEGVDEDVECSDDDDIEDNLSDYVLFVEI